MEEPKGNYFEIKITGRSTTHTEAKLIDLLYQFLKDKAEFKTVQPSGLNRYPI